MKTTIISERFWGESKLKIPKKEMDGAVKTESIVFSKAKCPTYISGNALFIRHRDWFSSSISISEAVQRGIIEPKKSKFVYNDNFGSVVLRNEAWLKIEIQAPEQYTYEELKARLLKSIADVAKVNIYDLLSSYDWNHFAEQCLKKCLTFY